ACAGASSARLRGMLAGAGLCVVGATSLFVLVRDVRVPSLWVHLCKHGILTRVFSDRADDMRIGLPRDGQAWRRLETALTTWSRA
ncbi:threonine-phosphate decarboxylase, partial [Ameyamaea chiangmaiensis]|nr:threonine-phosphate decarboxylase [Ameyamaea chiangmaiensis]